MWGKIERVEAGIESGDGDACLCGGWDWMRGMPGVQEEVHKVLVCARVCRAYYHLL